MFPTTIQKVQTVNFLQTITYLGQSPFEFHVTGNLFFSNLFEINESMQDQVKFVSAFTHDCEEYLGILGFKTGEKNNKIDKIIGLEKVFKLGQITVHLFNDVETYLKIRNVAICVQRNTRYFHEYYVLSELSRFDVVLYMGFDLLKYNGQLPNISTNGLEPKIVHELMCGLLIEPERQIKMLRKYFDNSGIGEIVRKLSLSGGIKRRNLV